MMRVGRHVSVDSISANTYDTGFAQATDALQNDVGASDVACDLELSRTDTWWFSDGGTTGTVTNQAEYQADQNNAAGAYMVVVNTIDWCGLPLPATGGCGWPTGGRSPFLVTRNLAVSPQRGIVYAHEFGHTVGLNHDGNNGSQIMDGAVLGVNDTRVRSATVCNTFRTSFLATCSGKPYICSFPGLPGFTGSVSETSREAPDAQRRFEADYSSTPIREVARAFIVDRLPLEVEDYYTQEDVAILKSMLTDSKEKLYHPTIVVLIGLISDGSDADVDALNAYAAQNGADKGTTMWGLGYIHARTRNARALQALRRGAEGDDAVVSERAMIALAVTGTPEALPILERRRARARANGRSKIDKAIEYHRQSAELGLRGFYDQPPAEPTAAPAGSGEGESGIDD
jgi:hypothetical protein